MRIDINPLVHDQFTKHLSSESSKKESGDGVISSLLGQLDFKVEERSGIRGKVVSFSRIINSTLLRLIDRLSKIRNVSFLGERGRQEIASSQEKLWVKIEERFHRLLKE